MQNEMQENEFFSVINLVPRHSRMTMCRMTFNKISSFKIKLERICLFFSHLLGATTLHNIPFENDIRQNSAHLLNALSFWNDTIQNDTWQNKIIIKVNLLFKSFLIAMAFQKDTLHSGIMQTDIQIIRISLFLQMILCRDMHSRMTAEWHSRKWHSTE